MVARPLSVITLNLLFSAEIAKFCAIPRSHSVTKTHHLSNLKLKGFSWNSKKKKGFRMIWDDKKCLFPSHFPLPHRGTVSKYCSSGLLQESSMWDIAILWIEEGTTSNQTTGRYEESFPVVRRRCSTISMIFCHEHVQNDSSHA